MTSLDAQRAAEFHSLIEPFAGTIQNLRLDLVSDRDHVLEVQSQRRIRLDELAALLNASPTMSETWDVDEIAERWIRTHPLSLNSHMVAKELAKIQSTVTVWVRIGEPEDKRTRAYPLYAGDVTVAGGAITFGLPESVAEEFRQQGRRQLQREHADLMAVQSHR